MADSVQKTPRLAIVVPCYNEEEVLPVTKDTLTNLVSDLIKKKKVSDDSFVAFVDDGSRDITWKLIEQFSKENALIKGVKLSRNFGHQGALLAGLNTFTNSADCVVSIDADLQDDVKVIEDMVDKYNEGFDIVYGVRNQRKTDTFFKRTTALGFYKLMKWLGVEIIYNHADYRLTSSRVLQQLNNYNEVNLFLRGIFPLIGYPSTQVYYDRLERFAGESKYPLKKMLAFAFDGISSFSVKPLRMVSIIGFLVFFVSVIMAIYSLISYFYLGTVPGWTSITLPIYFISGIQILCIGIIGEYLGKVYKEVKARPRFVIETVLQ
ncbi:MAG: glycosyltransferase family 2 protein [Bacteroidales bacterium]|nr:glycosyltransferase family 2 protein [Bacteroidales bacterium]